MINKDWHFYVWHSASPPNTQWQSRITDSINLLRSRDFNAILCDKVFVSSHLSIAAFDWKNSNQKSQVMAYFPSISCYKVFSLLQPIKLEVAIFRLDQKLQPANVRVTLEPFSLFLSNFQVKMNEWWMIWLNCNTLPLARELKITLFCTLD